MDEIGFCDFTQALEQACTCYEFTRLLPIELEACTVDQHVQSVTELGAAMAMPFISCKTRRLIDKLLAPWNAQRAVCSLSCDQC